MSDDVLGLPSSWCKVRISDVAELNPKGLGSGFAPADGDEVHFVPMSAVAPEFGGIDVSQRRPFVEVRKGYTQFSENDVLLAKITPCMENGKLAIVPELPARVGFGSTEFHVLRSGEAVQPAWLALYLSRQAFRKEARQNMTGSAGQLRVSTGWLSSAELPLPPAAEQTRIVAKLEELLSDLDAGVAELKAAQAKLQQYRQSLLKAAVEGSLTRAWREANPAPEETGADLLARIQVERRARWEAQQLARFEAQGKAPTKGWREAYAEPARPNAADMPALPTGWTWASAEQLCTFITKGTTPPKGLDTSDEKTIPFLRVTNLTDRGVLDMTDKVFVSDATHQGFLARSKVVPGDVLMNIVGPPLGQVALVPGSSPEWNINQAIAIFRAVDGVLPDFICCYLLSPIAQRWLKARAKTTAGQTNLTLEVCRQLPIPLAPMGEQKAVVNALAGQLASLDTLEDAVPAAERQSTAQRQNLLRAAFAGQLVPQDPADEPASELLARIRAERAARGIARTPRAKPVRGAKSLNSVETIPVGAVE